MSVPAAFYFDLRSPQAYLAAERALVALPAPCEWQPILARMLPAAERFDGYRCERDELAMRENVERRAAALAAVADCWGLAATWKHAANAKIATPTRRE